jgi:hypothetical protein
MEKNNMSTEVKTTLTFGFQDHDKNKPMFTLSCSPDELLLLSKLISHVNMNGSDGGRAAFNLISAFELCDGFSTGGDLYELANNKYPKFTAQVESQFGGVAAVIHGDDVVLNFED